MDGDNASILIVEDEYLITVQLRTILERAGYAIDGPVGTGAEALTSIAARQPDVVLMDIRLPGGMDGIEATRLIRTRYDVPVIILTGYLDEETIAQARQVTPIVLEKPVTNYSLEAAVKSVLADSGNFEY